MSIRNRLEKVNLIMSRIQTKIEANYDSAALWRWHIETGELPGPLKQRKEIEGLRMIFIFASNTGEPLDLERFQQRFKFLPTVAELEKARDALAQGPDDGSVLKHMGLNAKEYADLIFQPAIEDLQNVKSCQFDDSVTFDDRNFE